MASFSQFGNDLYTGARSIDFVGRRRRWYLISLALILITVVGTVVRGGFVFSIEFTGGSEFTVSSPSSVDQTIATTAVTAVVPATVPRVSVVGDNSIRVQTGQLMTDQSAAVRTALAQAYGVGNNQVASSFIGAAWGSDVTQQAIRGLIIFVVLAALAMWAYFRTWKMSLAAIVALLHDLVIVAGVYGITGTEVSPAAVIGLLTILGYSLYDTVVVFDKIRENTAEALSSTTRTFSEIVNLAENQTLVRSINTSIVAALPVAAILVIGAFIFGAGTLRDISLALLIGIIVGTYSTIFVAAPLYAQLRSRESTIVTHDKRVALVRARASTSVVQGSAEP
ncbi:protein translocase subunit SecF [Rathayibacter toxicus]|uniref:Protein-export membrane protein SecF n=1 Tax=Rathayibacter toxicus TaxID=145458 RepID=A0A0C5BHQ3_9MICO|nr:protein translocase subunit SecF [Rathayibacter toxicus]AJM77800.1 preprotein translocase subunit SecF [Rathayibacter toxicus]ALS58024.1 preprotein translocase subunit SecF [Rathayibacter toxicus]KKM44271.1 preprotein translocase subunit SecF [Rathayibacter toxicus]PPG20291.1 protein translocase subunit SecF [Rathayibacter toxicus]PPG45391.1 protein translocase subunit SecF [Rathayibacter toxicus]